MPLDTQTPDLSSTGGFDTSAPPPGSFELGLIQDQQVAGRGLSLYQPSPAAPPTPTPTPTPTGGYATPQHAGVTAIRGYDPLRTTATWDPDAKPLTQVFNPFPTQATPQQEPGEWNYLKRLGWDTLMKTGDAALGVGRLLNTAIGDMTTQAGGGNEWVEQHLDSWHQAIQGEITDNIKAMGDGHRNAYEGSILRSLNIGPEQDEQGNPIPGVFEGGGGVGRFANYVAARVAELIPMGVAGLVSGGPGAVAMLGAQTLGEQYNATADQVGRTDDKTYQATNPIYRDLRQNQGYTEMQAKQEMLQHAMLAALASAGINMAGAAVGMYGAPAAFSPALRRVWGAVMGGAGFGVAGGASSAAQQKVMTGDIDVVTAMREALNQGLQGVAMGVIFGAHARERPGEVKPPGEPDTSTAGVDADAATAIAARPKAPEQTEMFAPTQMGPTVARSPEPAPTEPTATPQPPGTTPITPAQQPGQPPVLERTPGPYAPQTYPAYGPEGPTVVSRPEGMPQAKQPAMFENIPEQGPSGPIVPPTPGGGGAAPRAGAVPPAGRPPPTGSAVPPSTQAAVATSRARGAGQAKVTPGVTPTEAPGGTTGLETLGGAGKAMAENLRNLLWQKHQAGEITEGGAPSNILQASKWLKDRGIITDRASFNEFLDAYGAAGDQTQTSAGLNKFARDYAEANRPEAAEAAPTPGAAEPTATAEQAQAQGVPFMVTAAMKSKLRDLGYTPADISEMTPQQAHDTINAGAPKLSTRAMREELVARGYRKSLVKDMTAAEVRAEHAKPPPEPEKAPETAQEKPPVETEPEGVTIAATQAEPVAEAEAPVAERVPAAEREQFPAQPREEGPPIAEPLTGRALERARLAEGREIPVKGEAAVAEEREPETVQGEQGRLELPAPENTPENRREAMHAMVQEQAPQVIQARGKANIDAMVKRAADYLHRAIEETDGTREGVAEKLNDALEKLPEGAGTMPGTNTTWRNYIAQMMTRLTGHEPTAAAAERAEVEGARREEQARVGAEPARKVSGEDIEAAVAAPTAGEGPAMEPVARKPVAETVTRVRDKAENLIKRLRDGDLTPAEAAAEYDKPVGGETRGAKRSKGYGTFKEVLQTRLAQAADPRAERNILDEMHRVSTNRELAPSKRNAMLRKLENDLKNYGPEVAHELQDWLERLDDPVGKALDDEQIRHSYGTRETTPEYQAWLDDMARQTQIRREFWKADGERRLAENMLDLKGIHEQYHPKWREELAKANAKIEALRAEAATKGRDPTDVPYEGYRGQKYRDEVGYTTPRGIDPRSSTYYRGTIDDRISANLVHAWRVTEEDGQTYTLHDALRLIQNDALVRAEQGPLARLATRLLQLAPDIPVHSFEQEDALMLMPARERALWQQGRLHGYHTYNTRAPERFPQRIALNLGEAGARTNKVVVLLHEAIHAAAQRYLDSLERTDPNHVHLQALEAIRAELGRARPRDWENVNITPEEEKSLRYATTNIHEILSEAMSNPQVQSLMATMPGTPGFRATMARLGFAPREPKTVWSYFTNWVRKALGLGTPRSASEYTFLDYAMRPMQDIVEQGAQWQREKLLPQDPVLRPSADESANGIAHSLGPTARQAMDTISRSVDYGRLSDARRGLLMRATPLDRLVDRFGDAMPGLHTYRLASNMIQYAGKQFSDTYADRIKTVARRITSADDRQGLQSLMNEATLNEMHLRPGGDNSHLTTPEQQQLLRELKNRYNALSAKDRETYNLTNDLHNEMYQDIRDAQLKSMVNIHMPDADEATTNAFVRAARTREGLDRYVENTDQAHRDVTRAIADFHRLGYVQGDYFPLRRYGNYVVRYGDRDDLNSYGVEFFENRTKAEERRKELIARGVPDVYRVDGKDERPINELAPSHPAVEALISRLGRSGFDDEQQALVREQMNRIMVQQATRSARSRLEQTYRRRGIRGASEDQARALHYDFVSNSDTIGHLLWGPARARSLIELRNDVENLSKPGAPDTDLSPVTGRTVVNEMARRANRLNDPDNVVHKIFRGVNLFNYLHSLGSLSHMVTSTMDAHTNSMALAGARYGYGRYGMNLTRALGMLTPEMAKTGVVNTIKGVAGELKAKNWNLGHIARDRAIRAGLNAEDMRELFDQGEKYNLIDHTLMTDLRRGARGPSPLGELAGDIGNRYLNLVQASAHATDVNNKAAIMVASYLSHLAKFPGDREGAINAGIEFARKSMPNYSQANKGSIDRFLGPLLQFKRYGIHELTLMANLARESMHGEHKFESAKALAGVFLTRAMMAGAITTIADPLKYIMGAWDWITGKPGPNNRQAAIRGWLSDTFGPTAGEIIGRGLPHALGIDVSHRVGLENLLELPELRSFDKSGFGEMLLGLTMGASGESLQDIWQALGKAKDGDVGGMLRGIVPRLLRDPMKAYGLAEQGVTDSKGKVILPASRIGAGSIAAQALGFQPTTVSEFREGRNAALEQRGEITSEHSRLEQKWLQADPADRPAVMAEINAFNRDETTRRWGGQLTMDQLMRARAAAGKTQRAPFGLTLPAKAYQGARYVGRFANIGSPIPAAAAP